MRLKHAVLVALATLALSLAVTVGAAPDEVALEQLADIVAAQERATPHLLGQPGVVGTGVGLTAAGRGVLDIYVEDPRIGFPARIEGVRTRVVVTGPVFALQGPPCGDPPCGGGGGGDDDDSGGSIDPTSRFDSPVPIGVSTGHPNITAGTIGARVTDGTSFFALSNNHVYADENQASFGDFVLQPGPYDGGTSPADDIGELAARVPLLFEDQDDSCPNRVDAAIATVNDPDRNLRQLGNATPSDGYGAPSSTVVEPLLNQAVMKYGRTTGQTSKKVTGLNATVRVGYDSGVACFTGQIFIRGGNFSAGGDSGSLVVTQNGAHPVGLLFAGSNSSTFANPIDEVLASFGVNIDGR